MGKDNDNIECLLVDVKTCSKMLGLGLRTTYRLVERSYREQSPLRILRFGTTYRISLRSIKNLVAGPASQHENTGGL